MFTVALSMLGLIPWRVWLIGAVVAGLGLGFVVLRSHYINEGYAEAIASVKAANEKSEGLAANGVKDVTTCFDGGGTWNRDTGKCETPSK